MKNLFKISFLLVSILLFTQCDNKFAEEDLIENPPEIEFEDQVFKIGKGEMTLLDLKKQATIPDGVTIEVENADELLDRLVITEDGLLAYRAPDIVTLETIELSLEDAQGNVTPAKVEVEVVQDPVVTYCSGFDVVSVNNDPVAYPLSEITGRDTECGLVPNGDFEIIFPPVEMEVEVVNGELVVSPNPGGIGFDVLGYRGNFAGIDSAYIDVLWISNQAGCVEGGVMDLISLDRDTTATSYRLDVLDNDQFCTFTRDEARIIGTYGAEHGTIAVIDSQYLEYTPAANATYPINDNFTSIIRYQQQTGTTTQTVPAGLTIK